MQALIAAAPAEAIFEVRPKSGSGSSTRFGCRGYLVAFLTYLAATGIALVSPWVALALTVAVRLHLLRIRFQHSPTG